MPRMDLMHLVPMPFTNAKTTITLKKIGKHNFVLCFKDIVSNLMPTCCIFSRDKTEHPIRCQDNPAGKFDLPAEEDWPKCVSGNVTLASLLY